MSLIHSFTHSCSNCGKSFILPQELCRHTRDKLCSIKMKQPSASTSTEFKVVQTLTTDNGYILKSQTATEVESIVSAGDATTTVPSSSNIKLEIYDQLLEETTVTTENTVDKHDHNSVFQLSYICEQCDFG